LNKQFLDGLALTPHDVLLIDHNENHDLSTPDITAMLAHWTQPVLYNDTMATEVSLQQGNPEFGRALAGQLLALAGPEQAF